MKLMNSKFLMIGISYWNSSRQSIKLFKSLKEWVVIMRLRTDFYALYPEPILSRSLSFRIISFGFLSPMVRSNSKTNWSKRIQMKFFFGMVAVELTLKKLAKAKRVSTSSFLMLVCGDVVFTSLSTLVTVIDTHIPISKASRVYF